jgi:hypothetical protein
MSPSTNELEEFARDCVRLAGQADAPELRDKLLNIAREWMRAATEKKRVARSAINRLRPARVRGEKSPIRGV